MEASPARRPHLLNSHLLEEPRLEPEGRLRLRGHAHDGVGRPGQLLELVGAARAGPDVRQHTRPLAPGQHAERQLGQIVFVLHTVVSHRSSFTPSAWSMAARNRMRAVRIRVLAVPRGIPSDSLISSAVRP